MKATTALLVLAAAACAAGVPVTMQLHRKGSNTRSPRNATAHCEGECQIGAKESRMHRVMKLKEKQYEQW